MKVSRAGCIALCLMLLVAACNESPPQTTDKSGGGADEVPLAYVNGSTISAMELESARSRFHVDGAMLDAHFDDTLLQSLVSSRAMALLAEGELDVERKQELSIKVAAYREELLVKEYLKGHAEPVPVSESMVKAYYDKHPEEFSGGSRKEFEYFSSNKEALSESERKAVLQFMAAVNQSAEWESLLATQSQLPLVYRKAKARLSVLDEPLKTLVTDTPLGNVSPLHMGNQLVVVRVLAEETIPPRPLADVSGEIRKRLAPLQLRQAVKTVSEQALNQVKVTYPNTKN